ncbi:MAG: permease prefix domain 1-containing protein [Syntrophomonadales bacterium]|jgi:cytochrome c biogenesis protein CcdA
MTKNEIRLDHKIRAYFDNLFSNVGGSQQLFELKEELTTNMKEKIADYRARGMNDEQAFKEAVVSMGDLSGLVDDMRKLGQDMTRQTVYSSMANRISAGFIVVGVLLALFGMFVIAMTYFMNIEREAVAGSGIFVVAGGTLFTYGLLTRETSRKYAMNKIRAALYGLSIGLIMFGLFAAVMTYVAVGETYVSIASLMFFFLGGVGLFLILALTGTDRRKP